MSKKKRTDASPASVINEGRVVRNTGSTYIVRLNSGAETVCRIKGNFRIKGIRTTNPVAVGDIVEVAKASDDADYIVAIKPRANYIIRRASNLSKESHILAANIDLAILVSSLREPATTTIFIDRFLATAEAYSVNAAIIINKMDLWDDEDRELAFALKNMYENVGYPVFHISAANGDGLRQFREAISGKVSLLAGNSGVGKSSIINAIVPDANLRTGEISDIHHTGVHTTTFSEIISIPDGGELIDIPGVRGFGTIDFKPEDVGHYFPEIFKFSSGCRYSDCKHVGEPGCAVLPAVENHYISGSRYNSYLSILEEASGKEGADKYRKGY